MRRGTINLIIIAFLTITISGLWYYSILARQSQNELISCFANSKLVHFQQKIDHKLMILKKLLSAFPHNYIPANALDETLNTVHTIHNENIFIAPEGVISQLNQGSNIIKLAGINLLADKNIAQFIDQAIANNDMKSAGTFGMLDVNYAVAVCPIFTGPPIQKVFWGFIGIGINIKDIAKEVGIRDIKHIENNYLLSPHTYIKKSPEKRQYIQAETEICNNLWILRVFPQNRIISSYEFILTSALCLVLLITIIILLYLNKLASQRYLSLEIKLEKEKNLRADLLTDNRTLEKKMTRLNSSKSNIIEIISHDLKNPFSALIGLPEMLLKSWDKYDNEQLKKNILIIANSSKMLYQLLENLLQWSRLELNEVSYMPKKINICSFATQSFQIFSETATQKGIIMSSDIPSELYVWADSAMLEAILRNLIANAIKYTQNSQKVHVQINQTEKLVNVAVFDEGTGISKADQANLFNLKNRFSRVGTSSESGSGLGLYLCKEYIEKNGGVLSYKSEEKKGSVFTFNLPVYETAVHEPRKT